MEAIESWWQNLDGILKVFWGLAIPFTLFFALQLIFSFSGADSPDDLPDAEIEADHGIAFQFLTLKNLIGFFTIFSWAGIASVNAGLSNTLSVIVATVSGVLMMALMASLFYLLGKATADGTMKIDDAIGKTAEVYLMIGSQRTSIGKVQVKVTGSLRTLEAITDDQETIATGSLVKVVGTENNLLLVTSK
jgi:membrane protein implicated in regulation of membrane protease activity